MKDGRAPGNGDRHRRMRPLSPASRPRSAWYSYAAGDVRQHAG